MKIEPGCLALTIPPMHQKSVGLTVKVIRALDPDEMILIDGQKHKIIGKRTVWEIDTPIYSCKINGAYFPQPLPYAEERQLMPLGKDKSQSKQIAKIEGKVL